MEKEKLYEVVEELCRAQIQPEEEGMYGYVKESFLRWICDEYDWESWSEEIPKTELNGQIQYYIRKFKEAEGDVKSTKAWEMLEEAYLIAKGELAPERSKNAEVWKDVGLDPDAIMYYAMERFAQKKIKGIKTIGVSNDFMENVVAEAIAGAGAYRREQLQGKETIYDKCKNEKAFCAYFGKICVNKYLTEVKKEIRDRTRNDSYDVLLEKGIEVGDTENGSEGSSSMFTPKPNEWQKELRDLLKLVLRQVAKGPLKDYGDAPDVYRNAGGAFAKYVPFLEEAFVEKNGRYELFTYADRDVPEELIVRPKARKGSGQAANQMYPIIENHAARSVALLFEKIINGNLESVNNSYEWTDDFYNRIRAYENDHGKVLYGDVIGSVKTMENHANAIHKAAIEKSKEILEGKLTAIDRSMLDSDVLMKELEKLLR